MKILLIVLSVIGLGLTVIPAILVFMQELTIESHKSMMLIGMILWFSTSPFWLKEQKL